MRNPPGLLCQRGDDFLLFKWRNEVPSPFLKGGSRGISSGTLFPKQMDYNMDELFAEFIESRLDMLDVIVMCGLPATGKSTAAKEIAKVKGFPIVATDAVRAEVLAGEDVFDPAVASDMEKRSRVYEEVFRRADEVIQSSHGVILDGTFVTQSLRKRAAGIAERHGRRFVIMETRCSEKTALRRISERTRADSQSNALSAQAYLDNRARLEPVDLDDLKRGFEKLDITHVVIDAESDDPRDWRVVPKEG
ncbi:MAG: ATP-binding protein [Chloroflexi bacterium]|nr:ATP-binding protein [Chloroflexota bacterium]